MNKVRQRILSFVCGHIHLSVVATYIPSQDYFGRLSDLINITEQKRVFSFHVIVASPLRFSFV
jgi:hypothetical protein